MTEPRGLRAHQTDSRRPYPPLPRHAAAVCYRVFNQGSGFGIAKATCLGLYMFVQHDLNLWRAFQVPSLCPLVRLARC